MSGRGKLAALLAILVMVAALFWAMQAVVSHNALQNCLDSGRRDCGLPGAPYTDLR